MAFTERKAKAAKCKWEGKDTLLSVADELFLDVRRASKTWIIRPRINGKMRVRPLGKYPSIGVEEARAQAIAETLERDPGNRSLADICEDWFSNAVSVEHRRPHLVRGYLDRGVLSDLGHRRAREVTPAEIAASVKRCSANGSRAADALRSTRKSILSFTVENGIRPDNPTPTSS